jgi:asparagine synthase (glutamine-hydrolysing)
LHGDFAFAIWDALEQKLFCARDHFGIRPFYYADLGGAFVFSNTLNTVLFHPQVQNHLNERAVGDFLLCGLNCDNSTTIYKEISRLPPAHTLTVSASTIQQKLYWSPPTDGRIRYRHPQEYVENFQSIFLNAIADRLRSDRAGILLSGGLDSGSVAATAQQLAQQTNPPIDLFTYTFVHESLPHDQEGILARETAQFLKLNNCPLQSDQTKPFELPSDPSLYLPEPLDSPLSSGHFADYRRIAADCRILFSGEGGDNLMNFQLTPYFAELRRRGEWPLLITESLQYLRHRPFPWRGIKARILKLFGNDPLSPDFPIWFNPDFVRRLSLKDRWRELSQLPSLPSTHPVHPKGHASLALPQWTNMFETENAGVTRQPVEVVYPFLDLRVVNYLLALPPFPWFFQKKLLREAMRGRLPEKIRTRPKTPLQGDPIAQSFQQDGDAWHSLPPWSTLLDPYINYSQLQLLRGTLIAEQASQIARPHCLNFWLHTNRRVQYK